MTDCKVSLAPSQPLSGQEYNLLAARTHAYGQAFAKFDATAACKMLSDDVVYESQMVLSPLVGKEAVAAHIKKRFEFLREHIAGDFRISRGEVELPAGSNYPCLILQRGETRDALLVLELNSDAKIVRLDFLVVLPHPDQATALGDPL